MSEVAETVVETPAPNTEATAVPVEAPVSGEVKPETKVVPPKTFSQEEVDAIVGKRLAKEERKQRERERAAEAAARAAPVKPDAPQKPQPEVFKTTEDYLEALTDFKATQIVDARLSEREKAAREASHRHEVESVSADFQERVTKVAPTLENFEEVAFNPKLSVTDHMANTIQQLERGPEVLFTLGKNPEEARRIAGLSPYLQAIELGRIEARLPEPKPAKKQSSAPEPINPVNAGGSSTNPAVMDTRDPRSIKFYGTASAWIEADNKRQEAEYRAKGYR